MKGSHIAVVNVPGPVHVHPTLSVVQTLIRRGYRVTYVTSGRFSRELSDLGAEIIQCPRFEYPYTQPDAGTCAAVDEQYSSTLTTLADRTLPLISSFYKKQNRPDLILCDTYAYAGRTLAEAIGVPRLRMTCHLAHDHDNLKHPIVPRELRRLWLEVSEEADNFFNAHGVPNRGFVLDREEPTIHFYLKDFQLSHRDRTDHLYAARCAAERPNQRPWKGQQTSGRSTVLISASTTYVQGVEYYRTCMDALSDLPLNIILSVGSMNDIASLGSLPANCEIAQGVPQLSLMPHVDLMICTGGLTTTMEAIYHGIPMIMLTHDHPEVEMYAQNVEEHGLGVHLRKAYTTARSIRRSVLAMQSDTMLASRMAEAKLAVRKGLGGEDVVNWIEDYTDGAPARR